MTTRLLTCLAAVLLTAPAAWSQAELQPPTGEVARAAFTTEVIDREPQDEVQTLANDHQKILYFTDLRDFTGQTITHRWELQGKVMAEVSFPVGGPRWRVHSSKELDPLWLGEWRVSVLDAEGNVLRTDTFTYEAADVNTASAPAEPSEPAEQSEPAELAAPTEPAAPSEPAAPTPASPALPASPE